jgi:PAS domain S-box-containing protein
MGHAFLASPSWVQAILEFLTDGVWVLDGSAATVFTNLRVSELLGYSADTMLGTAPDAYADPRDRPAIRARFRADSPGTTDGPLRFRHKDGRPVWAHLSTVPWREADGRVAGTIGILTSAGDDTGQDRGPRESEDKFRTIFDLAGDAVFIHDVEGRILEVNREACTRLGYTRDELLGKLPVDLEASGVSAGADGPGAASPDAQILETAYVCRDGSVLPVELNARPVRFDGQAAVLSIARDITERKRSAAQLQAAHRELAASEARYQLIAENSADVIWLFDLAVWRFTYVSPSVERLTGYTVEEFADETLEQLLVRDTASPIGEALEARMAAFAAGDPLARTQRDEMAQRRKDGSTIAVEVVTTLVAGPDGRATHLQGVTRDVSARLRAEAALRESERGYRQLFEQLLEGFAVHEILCGEDGRPCDYRFLQVNPAFERLTGLRAEAVVGRTVREVIPDIEPEWVERYGRVALTGEPVQFEQRADGLEKCYEVLAYCPERGKFATIFMDVTERRRTELALQESEQRFRSIVESSEAGYFRLNEAGCFADVNPAWLAMHGYEDAREVIGQGFELTQVPDDLPRARALAAGLMRGVAFPTGEFSRRRKDGGVAYHTFSVVPIVHDGRVTGAEGFLIDRTEQRRVEESLRASEAQFRHAQKMEAVGRLAGGIAHDFNNLLTAILGQCSLLSESARPGTFMAEGLSEVVGAAERAAALTRQLLMFSRKTATDPRPIALGGLARGMEQMLRRLLGEDIDLQILDRSTTAIFADFGQIEQVIMNLAVNARDAMPGGGRLSIDVSDTTDAAADPSVPGGRLVSLSVTDSGHGMDAETQARLFEPFFTTKALGKGTGLGLSTVYGIVQHSGGRISVQSRPGSGTTFTMTWPASIAPAPAPQPAAASPSQVGGRETILLVEDDDSVRRIVEKILTRDGYTALVAKNGQDALALAATALDRIDLLVTDIVMPGMRGTDLVSGLRKRRPSLKVLLMSGYGSEVAGGAAASLPLLRKPFEAVELQRAVRQVLDGVSLLEQ